jgi:multicomponent Na+:H+ antiporter subunit F
MNVLEVLLFFICVAFVLIFVRFLKGPTLTDRIVAFDTMSLAVTAMLVVLSVYFERSIYLDVAIVFALLGFIGTTVFGRFIEKGI